MSDTRSEPRAPTMRRGFLFSGGASLSLMVLLFIETMITVRLVQATAYGGYVLMIFVVNLLVTLVDLGCKTSITKLLATGDQTRRAELASSVLIFRVLCLALLALATWASQGLVGALDPSGTTQHYIVYVPLMLAAASIDELLYAMLQGFHSYKQMATALVMRGVLRVLLTLLFLGVLQLGLLGLIYAWLISFTISSSYQLLMLPVARQLICRPALLREMLTFGFPLYSTRFMWFMFQRINQFLVGWLAGPTSVAFYAVAATVPDALQKLSDSFTVVFFPSMAAMLARGQHERASRTLNESLRLLSFVVALGALIAVAFGHEVVTLIFSAKYSAVATTFGILMVSFQITLILTIMGYTLTAANQPKRSLVNNAVRTVLNLLGNLFFIPLFSFTGAALAALLASHTTHPLTIWQLRKSGISVAALPYLKQTLVLLVCCVLFWALQPTALVYKVLLVVFFVGANLALSTVTISDARLLLRDRQAAVKAPLQAQ